jgi:hypothetical protein
MTGASQLLHRVRRWTAIFFVLACAPLLALTACHQANNSSTSSSTAPASPTAESGSSTVPVSPTPTEPAKVTESPSVSAPVTSTAPDSFQQVGEAEARLVPAHTYWVQPPAMEVGKTEQIGFGIQSAPLSSQINATLQAIPGITVPARSISVSPHTTVRLVASPDAVVDPNGSQNQSTPSKVDMTFQWWVTPKSAGDLHLMAYVEVHLDGIPPPNDVKTVTVSDAKPIPVHAMPVPSPPVHDNRSWIQKIYDGLVKIAGIVPVLTLLGLGGLATFFRKRIAAFGKGIAAFFSKRRRSKARPPDVEESSTTRPVHSAEGSDTPG